MGGLPGEAILLYPYGRAAGRRGAVYKVLIFPKTVKNAKLRR
ncbi:hypothetical protein X925_02335 [Petrotoga sp. 9T1HF07.CasAA.8.2]|nr:hypothetical protein X925_02335 [Petrotoga sp. 9T1HF07.CasAA.8.2]